MKKVIFLLLLMPFFFINNVAAQSVGVLGKLAIGKDTAITTLDIVDTTGAAIFVNQKVVNFNSSTASSQLELKEIGTDYSRLNFSSSAQSSYWSIAAIQNSTLRLTELNIYKKWTRGKTRIRRCHWVHRSRSS